MVKSVEAENLESDLSIWLLSTIEGRWADDRIHSELVSKFGLSENEARDTHASAHDAVLKAITGNLRSRSDQNTDPIGYAVFNLVWNTFNRNSFFDKRRTPSRRWLDWKKEQEAERYTRPRESKYVFRRIPSFVPVDFKRDERLLLMKADVRQSSRSGLPRIAVVRLILGQRAASDPKPTYRMCLRKMTPQSTDWRSTGNCR